MIWFWACVSNRFKYKKVKGVFRLQVDPTM